MQVLTGDTVHYEGRSFHLKSSDCFNYSTPLAGNKSLIEPVVAEGYNLSSIAFLLAQREIAEPVIKYNLRCHDFLTGDTVGYNNDGSAVITLDTDLLREITSKTELYDGTLILKKRTYQQLKNNAQSLYLSADEIRKAHGKGFKLRKGKLTPANKVVAKCWEHLSRGKNLDSYVKVVSDESKVNTDIMRIYFDQNSQKTPFLRPLILHSCHTLSDIDARYSRMCSYTPFIAIRELVMPSSDW